MALDRAFTASNLRCDGFDGQLLDVVKQKDASAYGREVGNGSGKVFSKLLAFNVSARTRMRLCNSALGNGVQRLDGVCVFLSAEVVFDDVLGNPIHPRIKRRLTTEGLNAPERL